MRLTGKLFVDDSDDWYTQLRLVTIDGGTDLQELKTLEGETIQITLIVDQNDAMTDYPVKTPRK